MVDIEFRIGGRKIHPDKIGDELEKAVLLRFRDDIKKKIQGIRDSKTGERPKIIVKGRSSSDLSIEISGSESLIEEVKRRLS